MKRNFYKLASIFMISALIMCTSVTTNAEVITPSKTTTKTTTLNIVEPAFTDWSSHLANIVSSGGVVQTGDVGRAVEQLQFALRWKGYKSTVAIDGSFGTNTYNALRSYQSAHGLPSDGICGINTYNSIFGNLQLTWDATNHFADLWTVNSELVYHEDNLAIR